MVEIVKFAEGCNRKSEDFKVLGCSVFPVLLIIIGSACSRKVNNSTIRVGYFPNITHAQAVIGLANGTFASYLGHDIKIKATLFNAGPSIIEAIYSEDIDIAYVGPSPVVNGYVRSGGKALKVISGVASGGSLFIVRPDSNIKNLKTFQGKGSHHHSLETHKTLHFGNI